MKLSFFLVTSIGLFLSVSAMALECPLDNGPFGKRHGEVLKFVCSSPGGMLEVGGHLVFLPTTVCLFKDAPGSEGVYRMATSEKTLDFTSEDAASDDLVNGKLRLYKSERVYPSGDVARSYAIENTFEISVLKNSIAGRHSYADHSPMSYSYDQDFTCAQ